MISKAVDQTQPPGASDFRIANPLVDLGWDARLVDYRGAGFFHSRAWAEVLAGCYSFRPAYIQSRAATRDPVVLPLMEVSSWATRSRGVSLPFSDECGTLGDAVIVRKAAVAAAVRLGEKRAWASLEFRGGRDGFDDAPASQSFFGHTMSLAGTPQDLFARVDGSARTSVRKALQNGLTVDFSTDLSALRIFYEQLCNTRRRHGLPPQPFGFFVAMHRHALSAGFGVIAVARQAGRPVASAVFLHFGRSAIYKFAASDFEFRHLQANHLVLWRAIERYSSLGFAHMDFGRTSRVNKGLRDFKLVWRPQERTIDYVKYDFRQARFIDAEKERITGWHNRVFRLLPASISKIVGAAIYRHFA